MGKESEYLKRLLDTQKVIFNTLNSLLMNPVEEKTVKGKVIYMPYRNARTDGLELANCLSRQDEFAGLHDFGIVRFGPDKRHIATVKDVFKWCIDIAREHGPTFVDGVDREACWQWYERLLSGERKITPPKGLYRLRLGVSVMGDKWTWAKESIKFLTELVDGKGKVSVEPPKEFAHLRYNVSSFKEGGAILLFVGNSECTAIKAKTRAAIYSQLLEVKVKIGGDGTPVLPENPTIKDMTSYINKYVVGKSYSEKYIWQQVTHLDDVEPTDNTKQPFRYATDIARDKIVPHLLDKLPRIAK